MSTVVLLASFPSVGIQAREQRIAPPISPPAPPSSRREVHELPSEGTSDAWPLIALVCRTDAQSYLCLGLGGQNNGMWSPRLEWIRKGDRPFEDGSW